MDTLLEKHPHLYEIAAADITTGAKDSNFGRDDMPNVEQITRAAIYKCCIQQNNKEHEKHRRKPACGRRTQEMA